MLVTAAVYAGTGHLSITGVIVAGALGAIIGDNLGYTAGRYGGRALVTRNGAHMVYVRQPSSYPRLVDRPVKASAATEVWVMDANGTGRRRLYHLGCCGGFLHPIWSPDGKHIAFSSSLYADYKWTPKPSNTGLFVMDANGRHVRRLLADFSYSIAWQPVS